MGLWIWRSFNGLASLVPRVTPVEMPIAPNAHANFVSYSKLLMDVMCWRMASSFHSNGDSLVGGKVTWQRAQAETPDGIHAFKFYIQPLARLKPSSACVLYTDVKINKSDRGRHLLNGLHCSNKPMIIL